MNSDEFTIFPNPSKGDFIIHLPDDHSYNTLEILNIDGRIIYTKTIDRNIASVAIELNPNLPKGLYLIKLKEKDSYLTKKIVIN